MPAIFPMKRRKSPRSMSLASSVMSWADTRKTVRNKVVIVIPITSIPLCGNAKKARPFGQALDDAIFRRSTLGRFASNSASMMPENLEYDSRRSGNKLQIVPTAERPILITIVHDLLAVVLSDAPNAGEFFFSCGIQIKILRHKISPLVLRVRMLNQQSTGRSIRL